MTPEINNSIVNGVTMSEEAFMSLKAKEQNLVLFQNVRQLIHTTSKDKFNRKIQYVWLTSLTGAAGFILKWVLGKG